MERALPTYSITQGGITEAVLNDRLNQLDKKLSSQIFSLSASLTSIPNSLPASGGIINNMALSQRIDNLNGTTITNPTITGGSITGSSITGTISNAIQSALATIDDLTSNTLTATNATTTNLFASSFTALSASTTNATSTSLFSTVGHFASGVIDTLTSTNATTTNFSVTGTATSSFTGGLSAARINATATSTLSGLILNSSGLRLSSLNCTSYGNGGKLTTDSSGNVVCGADSGGAGSTVAGADTQIQFNNGGSFGAAANFTFSSSTGKLAVPYASTTALTTGTQWFTSLANSGLGVDANGKVYAAATSTLANISGSLNLGTQVTGSLALSSLAQIGANSVLANLTGSLAAPTAVGTTSLYTGAAGQTLAFLNGGWIGVATTTFSSGTGINLSYSGNTWTIANSIGYPFTSGTTFGTTTSATTSSIHTAGVFFASSTAAASQFPYASTTALTTGTQWFTSLANSGLGVDANGKIYAAATSTLANIGGVLALSSLANQNANTVLANATGASAAPTAIGTSSLFAALDGQILGRVNGTWTGVATTTFSTGLTYANAAVTCDTASGSILGCLSSTDWNTFNNKQAALTFTYPLQNNTNVISLAFATTTQNFWSAYNNFSSLFALSASTTNATTTNLYITELTNAGLGVDANGKVYAAATSTLATISGSLNLGTQVTGSLALSSIAQVGANSVLVNNTSALGNVTSIATSSFFGIGVGGTVLAWSAGVPSWVATTTLTNGAGITTTYSATNNQWTITNTGATFAFPFTTISTFGTTSAATSSSIQTAGVFFASSTAAASQFPFASSTAISISGTASTTNLTVSGLNAASCDVKASAAGVLSCGTDVTGSTFAFTATTYNGQNVSATSTGLWLTGSPLSLVASSTFATFASSTNASSSFATIGTQWFTGLTSSGLGVDANGKVYAAATTTFSGGLTYSGGAVTCDTASASLLGCLSSTDWTNFNNKVGSSSLSTFFTANKDWNVVGNYLAPTTTRGIIVSASSTIGNGAQAGGLTINGGATTTGNAYFGGNVGIATTSLSSGFVFGVTGNTYLQYASSSALTATNFFFTGLSSSGLGVDANGKVYAAATSTLANISGTLAVASGGTGSTTLTGLLLGNGASAVNSYAGSSCTNQFVRSINGSGVATCATINLASGTDVTGTLAIANGGTATTTFYNGGVTFYNSTLGSLSQGTAQSDFFFDVANKKLGLGTTTPWAKLSLSLNSGDTNPYAFIIASSTSNSTTTLFSVSRDGLTEIFGDIVSKGTKWTARSAAGDNDNWLGVAYGSGLFVAVGNGGNDRVITSPDGINWTVRSAAGNDDGWLGVTYGNGLFVAVGDTSNRVMTSPDGISWTPRSAAGDDDSWYGVSYGNGLFVAVGGIGNRVMTSPDGINWTIRSVVGDDDNWTGITYGNGLFVAVSNSGDRVITSPDGISWTAQSAAGDDDAWKGVTYGNGLFVAVSNSGDRVITSPDGISWTVQSAAGDNDSWKGVTYGNGLFVAVGSIGDRAMTSPDGTSWTIRSAVGNNDSWNGVTYGNGIFVSVSQSGDRVMTSGKVEQNLWTLGTSTVGTLLHGGLAVNGNVGIGTSTPWGQLSINPNGITGPAFVIGSSTYTSFLVANNGRVGIGTTTPSSLITVYGNFFLEGSNRYINFATTTGTLGYGLRDNAGTIEFKNSGGSWTGIGTGGGGAFSFTPLTNFNLNVVATTTPLWLQNGLMASTTSYFNGIGMATNSYLNFGSATGTSGYGFRDNAGTMEFKNSGGTWAGVNTATSGPSFLVNKNGTSQTVTTNAHTLITWSNEVFDTNNNFASNRFTPTVPGKYVVTTQVYCTGVSSNICIGEIYKNGAVVAQFNNYKGSGNDAFTTVTTIVSMNGTTDYLEVYGLNNGGTTIDGTSEYTYFTGALIAPVSSVGGGWQNDGTQSYLIDSSDSVGIGTSTPWARFTLAGLPNGTSALFAISTSTTLGATSTAFLINSQGRLGVGTTTNYFGGSLVNALTLSGGLQIGSSTVATTSYSLYNQGGSLYWNGSLVGSGSGASFSFIPLTNFNLNTNSTTTPLWLKAGTHGLHHFLLRRHRHGDECLPQLRLRHGHQRLRLPRQRRRDGVQELRRRLEQRQHRDERAEF